LNRAKKIVPLAIIFVQIILFTSLQYSSVNADEIQYNVIGININSDSDFIDFARTGAGTKEDPYIISGYHFEYYEIGIFISQTSKYVIITNCSFSNIKYEAIRLWSVKSGTVRIENNTIVNAKVGIFLYEAPDCTIISNKIMNCSAFAIKDDFSRIGSKIMNNTLYNNEEGITISETNYTQILNNYIIYSRNVGIYLMDTTNGTEIHHNFFLNANKPAFTTACSYGYYNNWTSNYWSDWDGSSPYKIESKYEQTFDTNPLSFDDSDGDKIIDILELVMDMNPESTDNDSDEISDYDELLIYATNPNTIDTDEDGITDYDEIFVYLTNPNTQDTDKDGITDYDEVFVYHTDPNKKDSDGDTFSDYEEILQKTNPRKSYSNPITKKYLTIFLPIFSGLFGVAFLSTRYYSNSKKNKIKVIFDTWNEFFNEWEKIIEQINKSGNSEIEEIIFEVNQLKEKKVDELEFVKKIVAQSKKLLIEHMKFNVELSLQKYKKQIEIFVNLQSNLIDKALITLNQITENTILNAVKDYLWMRFVYLYSTTSKSEAITTIEDVSGDALFNKFIKFYRSLDYEERLKKEISNLAEEVKFQINQTKKYEIELIESSINSIIDSLFDKFNKLEIDINILQEKIKDINIAQIKLDNPSETFVRIENIVKEEVNIQMKDKEESIQSNLFSNQEKGLKNPRE